MRVACRMNVAVKILRAQIRERNDQTFGAECAGDGDTDARCAPVTNVHLPCRRVGRLAILGYARR
jgi:hypothetical protein